MSRRQTVALVTILGLGMLGACGEDGPTVPPAANPTPTPTPQPSPDPTPTVAPEPSPTPAANRPPTVTVTGGGSCHPSPQRPCEVGFNALVSDPDGDPIAFGWDGCAQGNTPVVSCIVTRPGDFTATVLVSDGHENFARASGTAHGVNAPPWIRFGSPRPPNPAPSNTFYPIAGGQPVDPEEDEDSNRLCTHVSLTTSGPCRAVLAACGGVGDVFDVDLWTLQGPGTCVVEARVADVWGALGVDRFAFEVLP